MWVADTSGMHTALEGCLHRLHWVLPRKTEGGAGDPVKSPLMVEAWRRRTGNGLGP